jgi:coenzyme F420-0:L-glutamate ligase / coenzyme F420-1:gamma-L-glutamate ligase
LTSGLEIVALGPLPEVAEGDSLGQLIAEVASARSIELRDDDVIVVAQKVVSKAEGRVRELAAVAPGRRALELAAALDKDPRLVELVLAESRRVVRAERGVLIAETSSGWICANAGIDASNSAADGVVMLLPVDPDESARRLRAELAQATGRRPGVVVSDSFGRPWRIGQTDVAIGCAGVMPVHDWRGRKDSRGRELAATVVAVADQLAAAADLARDKTSRTPAVALRGAGRWRTDEDGPGAAALQRDAADDLFR